MREGDQAGLSYIGEDLNNIRDLSNTEIVALNEWWTSRERVERIDPATRTVYLHQPIGKRVNGVSLHPRYFLEGSADFLDQPGEWYADHQVVHYVPLKTERPGEVEAIVPVSEQLLILKGDPQARRPVRNITFRGLTFEHARWDLPQQGYTGMQAAFYLGGKGDAEAPEKNVVPPAIEISVADGCRFEAVRIEHVGGSGIWFGRQTTKSGLFDSVIDDVAGNGVMVGEPATRWVGKPVIDLEKRKGTPLSLPVQRRGCAQANGRVRELQAQLKELLQRDTERHPDVVALRRRIAALQSGSSPAQPNCSVEGLGGADAKAPRPAGGPWWQVAPGQAASGDKIENSTIRNVGQVFFGAVGVWIGLANHTTVARNTIATMPYTGISVGWMWDERPSPAHDNLIEANQIHDVMQVLSDGGAIYTLGRQPGTLVRDNIIRSIPMSPGRAESNGIFADEGSSGIRYEGNSISGVAESPFRLHRASHLIIHNNDIVVAPGQVPCRYNETNPSTIEFVGNHVR